MQPPAKDDVALKSQVASSLAAAPVIGVVRTLDPAEAERQAETLISAGLELIEVTFTVPGADDLVRKLLTWRGPEGPPWIGMGTVTNGDRAGAALRAGADFLVSPNLQPEVAAMAEKAGKYLILGALTCTEIVSAWEMGADIIKVYPLQPVGGPTYLEVIRGPLGDIPMLAAGGFGVEEIAAYRAAGASAFGIGGQLFGADDDETRIRVARALALARGETR